MKATRGEHQIAASDDIVQAGGYAYFPADSVRLDWLEKAPRTADDLKCPHGVQFYDVVIDGQRSARAAWSYEAPQPVLAKVGGRFGFWNDITVS